VSLRLGNAAAPPSSVARVVTPKATLASLLKRAAPGLRLNEHIEADGPTVFAHACKMGLEGIVSKRKGSSYVSGRSPDWLKSKNPASEAVRRETEEDGGRLEQAKMAIVTEGKNRIIGRRV
jgi:hypothetical protein